ncbi:MAG: SigB/SigF/SigG family RNA polymerase sigma factor [Christensenellaceae bacterium]|jgi:RNA polymerase sporulation-specific sigma factor|nr:SigB/SigF/SigG family RNA polymerase sigma factor [Christensenellaceae bacterium]
MFQGEQILLRITDAQNGNEEARSEIVERNMPLIKSIVRRYRNRQIEYDDLIQLGTLGLIKAINNFDLSFGVQFSTYAVPLIIGEIKRFIRDDGAIKVSRQIKTMLIKINRYMAEFRNRENRDPSIDEISKVFDIDRAEIIFILESAKSPVSIYSENDDDGLSICDRIADKEDAYDAIERLVLKDLINTLPTREKKIILLRYFRDKTQSEVAKELNVSQVQVSRLETRILSKLRTTLTAK